MLVLPVGAQAPSPPAGDQQAAVLAQGWAALAKGDLERASSAAQQALTGSPRSAAAVALVVQVEIVRGGPVSGLDAYERWFDAKRVDEAYVLRSVATAFLRGAASQRDGDGAGARLEALKALAADGDSEASSGLATAAAGGGIVETRLLAALGDQGAVRTLIAQLSKLPDKLGTIKALVDSGSTLAVPRLIEMLGDARMEHRAAAADALGRLGAHEAIDRIKPLLEQPNFTVRMSAAAALYRLGDDSGAPLLDQLLTSEHAAVRLGAAEALSVRPGGAWLNIARALTSDPDQTVQLSAARLIAPYDRDLAASVLDRLQQSENPAIREEASRVMANRVANDFAKLRKLLRSPDAGVRVNAAARMLELTR